ncbi:MAG: acyl-CoA dehydrogenase family protein [Desulfosalsimonadaceae bacterium]|nr:acyl-CoA dehydrogenase family protein [Desulfosalsimonadaceae bacterium]
MPIKDNNREYQMLGNSVREFAAKELLPHLGENDRYPVSDFFAAAMGKALELGYFHVMFPEDLNGWGGKITPLALILKAIAEVDASLAAILLTNAVAQEILTLAGAGEVLREIAAAQTPREFLTAYPLLTNPDEDKICLQAHDTDGRYTLTGQAEYVVLSPMAQRALLPARIAGSSYAYFLVDLEQPGIRTEGPILGMGLHACPAADLTLDHAEGRLIGRIDEGPKYFDQAVPRMLPAAAAVSCGLMQGSLKEALQYSRKRMQGGRKILDWSELRLILADMALKGKTADILLAQALHAADADDDKWIEDAYTAAIYILDAACELTSNGIQALGGYGYTKHHFQERRFRDAQHLRSVFGSANPRKLDFVKKCLNW